MLTQTEMKKAKLVSKYAQEYCLEFGRTNIKPRELLPYLVKKGVYNRVDKKNGSFLRDLLRTLDAEKRLDLIPQLWVERKTKNRYWYFRAL